jgi:hypothetical protein
MVPNVGYMSPDATPEIAAAFAAKADELALDGVFPPGDFRCGWLDCSYCCAIMARVAGFDQLPSFLTPDDVRRLFENAEWPSLAGLEKGPIPAEYAYIRSTVAFVELCLRFGLAIEIS